MGAGRSEGGLDAVNMLKGPLARGALRLIGATTLDEYRTHLEKDPALTRRLQVREEDKEFRVVLITDSHLYPPVAAADACAFPIAPTTPCQQMR